MKKRLGELLIEAGVIDDAQLQSALGHQKRWGGRLGKALVDLNMANEEQIVQALAKKMGYPIVRLAALETSPAIEAALKVVPKELAEKYNLLPYAVEGDARRGTVSVAMGDPTNIAAIDEIQFRSGRRVIPALAGDSDIAMAIRRLYYGDAPGQMAISIDFGPSDQRAAAPTMLPPGPTQAPDERHAHATPTGAFAIKRPLTERDRAVLDALAQLAQGLPPADASVPKPVQMVAALIRLLIRKNVVLDVEFLDELNRKP
jgi:type IV pilus assembly protein PilB